MIDRPEESPNYLNTGRRRGEGVRRLNRVPLLIAGILLLMILGAVTYTYQMRLADTRRKAVEAQTRAEPAALGDLFPDAPRDGLIPAAQSVLPPTAIRPAPPAEPPTENRDIQPPLEDDWERYRPGSTAACGSPQRKTASGAWRAE